MIKTQTQPFLITLVLSFVFFSCEPAVDFSIMTIEKLDSLYVFIPERRTIAPRDTSICFSREDLMCVKYFNPDADGYYFANIGLGMGTFPHLFETEWQTDTIHVFLFDVEIVNSISWKEIADRYLILQRYDFSLKDIEELKHTFFYPPTPEMAHIHMWPPYETIKAER